jgi:sugar phosphate isomerase/epimerase
MKKFILILLLAVAILGIDKKTTAQKPLFTASLGIEAYTFRKSFPVNAAGTLDTIKMMGFTELEGGPGNLSPQEFKKLCNERGISIPSAGTNYDELIQHLDSVVYIAKALGAKYVMCAWIPHDDGVLTFENAKKAVDDFNKAGKFLKEHGLTFCYHAHGYEFQPYKNGTLLDYIFDNTDPRYVSFEMDVFWIQFGGGDPVALMKKYRSRWKLMHLKDMRKGTKKDFTGLTSTENDVAIGAGELDIPSILKEAKKIGIKHYFIEDESNDPELQVPRSIAYLRSLKE